MRVQTSGCHEKTRSDVNQEILMSRMFASEVIRPWLLIRADRLRSYHSL